MKSENTKLLTFGPRIEQETSLSIIMYSIYKPETKDAKFVKKVMMNRFLIKNI